MIPRIEQFVPFGAAESPVRRVDPRELMAAVDAQSARPLSDDALVDLLQRSFGVTLLDALAKARAARAQQAPAALPARAEPRGDLAHAASHAADPADTAARTATGHAPGRVEIAPGREATTPARADTTSGREPPGPETTSGRGTSTRGARAIGAPGDERAVIEQMARRSTIDARFLEAIRRVENGGPGREFGVVSVSAPTYQDQARVAAETVRRNVERFEQTGKSAVDLASGRYTEEFVRFFSSRYAPVGAANDPTNLNRYHARNLIRLYAKVAPNAG
jgi:hypothetical protein